MDNKIILRQPILDKKKNMAMVHVSVIDRDFNLENKKVSNKTEFNNSNKDIVQNLNHNKNKILDFLNCNIVLLQFNLELNSIEKEIDELVFLENLGLILNNKEDIQKETIDKLKNLNKNKTVFVLENIDSVDEIKPQLLECIDYIIIDIAKQSNVNMSDFNKKLKIKYDNKIKTIAKGIDTREEFELAQEVGFDYFQGIFFKKPDKVQTEIPGHQNNYMILLKELNNESLKFERLKEIIQRDMSMTKSILKTINNAYTGYNVSSIKDAAIMLGINGLKKWSMIYLVEGLGAHKPDILFINALSRANMAENLSIMFGEEEFKDEYFVMGMFSIIDAFVDVEKEVILNEIGLSNKIKKAILNYEGTMGDILSIVEAFDNVSNEDIKKIKESYPKKIKKIYTIYLESLDYANDIFMEVNTKK